MNNLLFVTWIDRGIPWMDNLCLLFSPRLINWVKVKEEIRSKAEYIRCWRQSMQRLRSLMQHLPANNKKELGGWVRSLVPTMLLTIRHLKLPSAWGRLKKNNWQFLLQHLRGESLWSIQFKQVLLEKPQRVSNSTISLCCLCLDSWFLLMELQVTVDFTTG